MENMKENYVVTAAVDRGEVLFQSADGAEQIGDEHQQGAFFHGAHDAMERGGEVRGGAFGGLLQFDHEMAQMAGPMTRRKIGADFFIEGEEADGVALKVEKISERGGESAGVLGLGIAE